MNRNSENDPVISRLLPRWAMMIVTGTPVAPDRAVEIIRRTDSFFVWPRGNNHKFVADAMKAVKMPDVKELTQRMTLAEAFVVKQKWEENWGLVKTDYVCNDWVSSSYIGGPHGWMHPDGTIEFHDNVGKWPRVEELLKDWEKIASAFPDIELEATVMSNEAGVEDAEPVASFLVGEGRVELVDPNLRNIHEERGRERSFPKDSLMAEGAVLTNVFQCFMGRNENAFSIFELADWADKVYGKDAK